MQHTTYTIVVLSEAPIPTQLDLEAVLYECDQGEYVLGDIESRSVTITGKEMVNALYAAGSEPGFFQLDESGGQIEGPDESPASPTP